MELVEPFEERSSNRENEFGEKMGAEWPPCSCEWREEYVLDEWKISTPKYLRAKNMYICTLNDTLFWCVFFFSVFFFFFFKWAQVNCLTWKWIFKRKMVLRLTFNKGLQIMSRLWTEWTTPGREVVDVKRYRYGATTQREQVWATSKSRKGQGRDYMEAELW